MNAAVLFGLTFIQWGILTLNTTAIAKKNHLILFVTDLILAVLGFTILKEIVVSHSFLDLASYALGGALGAQLALLIGDKFL